MSEIDRTIRPRAQWRRHWRKLVVWVFALAASPLAQAADSWRIHAKGLGPIQIGMPIGAVARRAGVPVLPIGVVEAPDRFGSSCNYYSVDVPGQMMAVLALADERLEITDEAETLAESLENRGIEAIDAVHLALASTANVDFFGACDTRSH